MLGLIFEYVILYLWCQILAKFDVKNWLTTWLFVYVPESDHKTDPSGKKICFVGWHVGLSFPHPNNCLHKLKLSLVVVGEKWAGPVFPHPLRSKGCLLLPTYLLGWGKNGQAEFFSTPVTICARLKISLVTGKGWASSVFPHPYKSKGCLCTHGGVGLLG